MSEPKKKPERPKPPSLAELASNFTKSTAFWAKRGFPISSKSTWEARRDICLNCEFWDSKNFWGAGRCLKCGCTGAKLWMATASCPIGKWEKEDPSRPESLSK